MTTGARPLLDDVGQIYVRAPDLPRAVAFYRDTLGLTLAIEAPKMAFFQCGNLLLLLGPAEQPQYDHPASIVYFRTADLVGSHQVLSGRGVKFVSQPHVVHRAGGRELWMAFFEDSEGNTLALMQWRP